MVWGLWRLGVVVDHDFGRPAVPTRGIGRALVALTLPQGFMGSMGCTAVEITAVWPAGRVKWSDILAWRRFVGPACLTAGTLAQATGRRPGNRWQHRDRHLPHSQTFALSYFRRTLCVELGCRGRRRVPVCSSNGRF